MGKRMISRAAKSLQSCPTLCDPIDGSPPGSSFPGILQARTLEWVAISFSNASQWKVKEVTQSCPTLSDPTTAAHQALLSVKFSRQGYKDTGAGCHFLLRGNFLTQGSNLDLQHCRQILYQMSCGRSLYRPDKREQKRKSSTGCLSMLWDIKASKSMHSPCCHGAYSLAELHQVSKVYSIWGYFSLTPWCCIRNIIQ